VRVLHVVNDLNTGGAQTLIENLARLSPAGDEVGLHVLAGRGQLSDRIEPHFAFVAYAETGRNSVNVPGAVSQVRRSIGRFRPDVVHSHLLQSDLLNILIPDAVAKVSTIHSTGLGPGDRRRTHALAWAAARGSGRLDAAVACSGGAREYMRSARYRAPIMTTIENGVALVERQDGSRRGSDFVCMSRWHPMKDHATLASAFATYVSGGGDGDLLLAGTGMSADNAELRALLDREGIAGRVEMLGVVQDIDSVYRRCRASVISSSYGEALPMAGLESLARGTPVITTDVGDCRSLAAGPELLVPAGDPEALAAALRHVQRLSASAAEDLGDRAHAIVSERYSIRRASDAYTGLYRQVVDRTGPRRRGRSGCDV
jgi:glycosyltransferase involved in cell wall biosynthesis